MQINGKVAVRHHNRYPPSEIPRKDMTHPISTAALLVELDARSMSQGKT
jgi:hypothetical protein